jgi:ABC-type amino acid transport system permease subunit
MIYSLPPSIILIVAVLTAFLAFTVVMKYAIEEEFKKNRLIMTGFFFFIVTTLTLSYHEFFFATLPYTIPAGIAGVIAGFLIGVPAAEERLKKEGLARYKHDFAQLEVKGFQGFHWWSVLNFYTVMGSLILINLVGLTTVILHNLEPMALATSAFGAFLIGSILPYLYHLWSISARQNRSKTTRE